MLFGRMRELSMWGKYAVLQQLLVCALCDLLIEPICKLFGPVGNPVARAESGPNQINAVYLPLSRPVVKTMAVERQRVFTYCRELGIKYEGR